MTFILLIIDWLEKRNGEKAYKENQKKEKRGWGYNE